MLLLLSLFACGPTGDADNGAVLYADKCVACHGDDGKLGLETDGEPAADLTRETAELSEEQLVKVIMDGKGTMPAQYADEQDAYDVAAYMKATF